MGREVCFIQQKKHGIIQPLHCTELVPSLVSLVQIWQVQPQAKRLCLVFTQTEDGCALCRADREAKSSWSQLWGTVRQHQFILKERCQQQRHSERISISLSVPPIGILLCVPYILTRHDIANKVVDLQVSEKHAVTRWGILENLWNKARMPIKSPYLLKPWQSMTRLQA